MKNLSFILLIAFPVFSFAQAEQIHMYLPKIYHKPIQVPTAIQNTEAVNFGQLKAYSPSLAASLPLSNYITALTDNQVLVAKGDTAVKSLPAGSEGSTLKIVSGTPIWSIIDEEIDILNLLGSTVKAKTFMVNLTGGSTKTTLANQTTTNNIVYLKKDNVLTGVKYSLGVPGIFTASTTNGIALYKLTGSTWNLVANTANDASLWKSPAGLKTIPFIAPYAASRGVYRLSMLLGASSITDAPQIYSAFSINEAFNLLTTIKISSTTTGQTTFSASEAEATSVIGVSMPILLIY